MDKLVSTEELAQLLGTSRQTVNQLARRGVIPKSSRGRFDLMQCLPAYCGHLRGVAAGHRGEGGLDLVQEKAKHTQAMTIRTQMDIAEKQGALILRSEVEEQGRQLATLVLNHLENMPSRVADAIAAAFGKPVTGFDVEQVLLREIADAITDFRQAAGFDTEKEEA